jgi:hypothetical protein
MILGISPCSFKVRRRWSVGRSFGYALDVYVCPAQMGRDHRYDTQGAYHARSLLGARLVRLPIVWSPKWLVFPLWLMSLFLPWRQFGVQHDQRLQIPVYANALRDHLSDVLGGDWAQFAGWIDDQEKMLAAAARGVVKGSSFDLRLEAIGLGVTVLGVFLAAREVDFKSLVPELLSKSRFEVLRLLQPIIGGLILIGVGVYGRQKQVRRKEK